MSVPAGWYPDPDDPARGRFWNGAAWTEARHVPGTPFPPPPPLRAPEGTEWNTPWIWLVILLPLVPVVLLPFVPWSSMFDIDPSDLSSAGTGSLRLLLSPVYWAVVLLSYPIYGLCVFFAYRDWKTLASRGVPRPFHWAWAFLSPVYPFGRSIVVVRRTGRGHAPLWAEIGVIVASLVVSGVITAMILGGMLDLLAEIAPPR